MSALLVGYARCSTDQQDLTAQRDALLGLGVEAERIYVDHGLTGTNRERPGLREALAACRAGDTLVVTKLDRLARSLPDARAIADELTTRHISLSLGGSVYDPTDAVGRLLFNVLAMVAEFESDLIRLRTREGMKVAKAKGRLRGSSPSSIGARKHTWSRWYTAASTAPLRSLSCSALAALPSTAPSNANASQRRRRRGRGFETLTPHRAGRPASDTLAGRRRTKLQVRPERRVGVRQSVRVRRLRARVGIITVAATRCSPRRAVMVAGFASERRGGTNEIAVSDTAVRTNRSAGRVLQRRRPAAMTMPTTEKKPVTTANPDNGIVSPPSGTSKSTPTARASAAARVVATIAASVAMKPVPASPRSRWVWLVWPDAGPATTPVSFMLFMSFLHHSVTAYGLR